MSVQRLPRRRIQRAFLQWMREHNAVLPFPLVVTHRTDSTITCRFNGITSAIRIAVARDLCVHVQRNGDIWDVLLWLDCMPQRRDDHFACPFCHEGERDRYASRESFWRARLFDPLSHWIHHLGAAKWLLLCESAAGASTWAQLLTDPAPPRCPDAVEILPVHVSGGPRGIYKSG